MAEASRRARLGAGAAAGLAAGFVVKELDLPSAISFRGSGSDVVLAFGLAGAVAALTRLRVVFHALTLVLVLLWALAAYTPLTGAMAAPLARRDAPLPADAVFVLGSRLQADGELTSEAMSRLLRGLELLSEGWAERLVLSEFGSFRASHHETACELMQRLGLEHEVIVVGGARNTREEAVLVGEEMRVWGFERLIVVTTPSHSRRASAALEAEGVEVVSVPAVQTRFDFENLGRLARSDERVRAFGTLLHEHAGLLYYRLRGWIGP